MVIEMGITDSPDIITAHLRSYEPADGVVSFKTCAAWVA